MGIATGASILSAQYFGAHDRETLSRVVGASILLTVISGLFMTFVGYSLSPWLMSLVSPPPDVLEGAVIYLQIIFIGILGGSLIIEKIFGIPGVGSLLVNAITLRDYNFFMALIVFYTFIGLASGILIDISYGFIDPRIRMGSKK